MDCCLGPEPGGGAASVASAGRSGGRGESRVSCDAAQLAAAASSEW